jgi:hypothetical protein
LPAERDKGLAAFRAKYTAMAEVRASRYEQATAYSAQFLPGLET